MPAENGTDHDRVVKLEGKVEALENLIIGNVPEKCVRTESEIKGFKEDMASMKNTINKIWERLDRPQAQFITALINAGVAAAIALIVSKIAS